MNEHDEHEPESAAQAEPVTERVRIVGAEPAAVLAGEAGEGTLFPEGEGAQENPEARYLGFVHDTVRQAPPPPPPAPPPPAAPSGEPAPVAPELPHWTEPPTGQVPAILDRRGDEEDGAWAGGADSGPVWREHSHEWQDDSFEPSMLADDATRVGALEETPVEERRPWEFDDLSSREPGDDDIESPEGSGGASWWDEGTEDPLVEPAVAGTTDTIAAPDDTAIRSPEPEPMAPASEPLVPDDEAVISVPSAQAEPPERPRPRTRRRPRPAPAPARRNVPMAVATGIGFAAVALACFKIGTVASLVLATVVVGLAAAECYAALRRAGLRPATLLGLVAAVTVMVSAYAKGTAALPLVFVLVVVTSMVWYLVGAERGAPVEGISATVLGFAWVGLLGSFAGLLLAPSIYPERHGIAFLFGAVVATVAADVGALGVGAWLGRHQLAPHVSPNKTWEGLVGGAVLAVVASAAITGMVHPWTPAKAAILGAVVAVVAPVGDLCESLVKRDLGLKDMGSLLPGHGGVLDRVDALLFVLPATYYLVRVLNLG